MGSVMNFHLCGRVSKHGQGKSHNIRYALNKIQFISDRCSAEIVLIFICMHINKLHSTI